MNAVSDNCCRLQAHIELVHHPSMRAPAPAAQSHPQSGWFFIRSHLPGFGCPMTKSVTEFIF
jgi:hypothetical protein